jgi:hypothetical protein
VYLLFSGILYYSVGMSVLSISGSSPVCIVWAVLYLAPSFSLGRPLHFDSPTLVAVGVVG